MGSIDSYTDGATEDIETEVESYASSVQEDEELDEMSIEEENGTRNNRS